MLFGDNIRAVISTVEFFLLLKNIPFFEVVQLGHWSVLWQVNKPTKCLTVLLFLDTDFFLLAAFVYEIESERERKNIEF